MLDVGGGPGYFRDAFQDRAARYFALDADVGELSGLGEIASGTVIGSGMQLPFADESVDVCYSSNVLEHVSEPWRMADEMVRVTRPRRGRLPLLHRLVRPVGWARDRALALPGRPASPGALSAAARPRAEEPVRGVACSRSRSRRGLDWARRQTEAEVLDVIPRYNPRFAHWLTRVPVVA